MDLTMVIFLFILSKNSLRFQQKKKLQELIKMYLTYYNLLIAQNLWQARYQILRIIFLKKFIVLNGNPDMMMKNVRLVELNISIATFLLNT